MAGTSGKYFPGDHKSSGCEHILLYSGRREPCAAHANCVGPGTHRPHAPPGRAGFARLQALDRDGWGRRASWIGDELLHAPAGRARDRGASVSTDTAATGNITNGSAVESRLDCGGGRPRPVHRPSACYFLAGEFLVVHKKPFHNKFQFPEICSACWSVLGNVDGAGRNPWGVAPRLYPKPTMGDVTHFTSKGNSYEETDSTSGLCYGAVSAGSYRRVCVQPSRSADFGTRSHCGRDGLVCLRQLRPSRPRNYDSQRRRIP